MKSMILCALLIFSWNIVHAKENIEVRPVAEPKLAADSKSVVTPKVTAPEGRYVFPLKKEWGPAKSIELTFLVEKVDEADHLTANFMATLRNGKTYKDQVLCHSNDDQGNDIACFRADGGGEFKFLKSKLISGAGDSFKYVLQLTSFLLSGEEEVKHIEIRPPDDKKPIDIPGTKEDK